MTLHTPTTTFDPMLGVHVTDIDASDLRLAPGQWPLTLRYNSRAWVLDEPKRSPDGDLEAFHYVPAEEDDYPEILCVWND